MYLDIHKKKIVYQVLFTLTGPISLQAGRAPRNKMISILQANLANILFPTNLPCKNIPTSQENEFTL